MLIDDPEIGRGNGSVSEVGTVQKADSGKLHLAPSGSSATRRKPPGTAFGDHSCEVGFTATTPLGRVTPITLKTYPWRRKAARTRGGVNGYCSIRTPVASKNALAMAAAAAAITSSPAPVDL